MIKFETKKKIDSTMYGGKGTVTYSYECDGTETEEELEKELRSKFYFDEEEIGCFFVENWYKKGNQVIVTERCWGYE